MDPTSLFAKISRLIQMLLLLEEKAKFHKSSCQTLVACIKLLTPILDEAQASKTPLTEPAVCSFEGLEQTFLKAVELLERCGGKASRFYVVLRAQQSLLQFEHISSEIECNLKSLPMQDLQLSSHAKEQVDECLIELKNASYAVDSSEEELVRETEFALKELQDGTRISHDKLVYLEGRFDFMSNQEILLEASFLEKEKEHARFEKNKVEEDFINRLIVLVTQMSDDLSDQKVSQDLLRGIPIPADFRCPLSLELMSDPVIVASGQTYERACIQQWLDQGNTTCPRTRQPLSHKNLIPNYTVKALIANWCEAYSVPLPEPTKPDSLELQQVSPLVLNKVDSGDHGHLQGAATVSRTSADQTVAANGSRLRVRSMRTIRSRVHEDHEADGTVVENDRSPFNHRSTVGRDPDGRHQSTISHDGDLMSDHAQGHSRNTSSSSLASSLDDVQTTTASDENNLEVPQSIGDSFPYNSDTSGELERLSMPTRATSHRDGHGSPVRLADRVSVNWRRRNEERDLSMPRNVPSSISDTGGTDSESIQLRVEQLVEDLLSSSIDVQRTAAAELRLLAKYNMENRIIIANCGAIGPLVTLLQSTDSETQENAVTALLNLSINDNNKNEIASAGAIDPLVNVLRRGNAEAKENAAATLFSLSVMDENKVAIGQSGAIAPLVDLLMHGTPRGKKDAATALFNLSILHDNKARIVRAGAVRPLVELMADPAAGMVDKAVAVLANLATTQEGRFSIGEEGGIPALVEVVELGSQRGKENAAAALLQLCTNSNRFRAMVLQEGAIPPLVALSQSGTARAKEKASALLRHFREQRHAVLGRGGMDRHMDRHFDRT